MRMFAIILVLSIILGALAPGITTSQTAEYPALILRVAVQGDIEGTNPFTAGGDYWTELMTRWLYDAPVYSDPGTGSLIPYIAIGSANISGKAGSWDDCAVGNFGYSPQSVWQNSSRKEAIIFYDFENVKWHDGIQMDIRDVMFSYHAAALHPLWRGDIECLMPGNHSETNWLHIEKVWENGSQAALRFTLQTPYWQFFNRTLAVKLLPEHVWAYKTSGQAVDGTRIWCDSGYDRNSTASWQVSAAQSYNNNPPIGSGLFKYDFREVGQFIKIQTNRDHFFKPGFKYQDNCLDEYGQSSAVQPHIDGISFKIILPIDGAVLDLKNADIDYIARSIPPSFVQDLGSTPGVEMTYAAETSFTTLAYNMRKSSFGYNNGDPANGDSGAPLRKAIAHLIDKNRIVSKFFLGLGIAADGPISCYNLDWYDKDSIIRYNFDPAEAKIILANAGYKVKKSDGSIVTGQAAIDAAGPNNWWINPDGSDIGSSADGKIDILAPEANYEPIAAQPSIMIAEQLRTVGIYAESLAMSMCALNDRIEDREFDMYLKPCFIDPDPTVFLYELFHSGNAPAGLNYPGYSNASFDRIIERARSTDDYVVRRQSVLEAQTALTGDLPYDVIYFKTNIEAYCSQRFGGWEVHSGTIFNRQSITNIRPSGSGVLASFIALPSSVVSNSTISLTVQITDKYGMPLAGANVWLNCSAGTLSAYWGVTDSNGRLTLQFIAPYVDPFGDASKATVILRIEKILHYYYFLANSPSATITVYPEFTPFVSVALYADPDVISDITSDGNQEFANVVVEITDQNGEAVAEAPVTLSSWPAYLSTEPVNQLTGQDGKAVFTVSSFDLPKNDRSVIECVLMASATHPNNVNISGQNTMLFYVIDAIPPFDITEQPPTGLVTDKVAIAMVAIVVALLALAVFIKFRKS